MAFADRNGHRIFWRSRGAGEPLLMITGLGYTTEMWHRIEPELAAAYRLILFDNRGVGHSDCPPGPYSILSMAADAAAVLDAAGIGQAHVFGFSMGGYIAQELALQCPQRVKSLILGSTACGGQQAIPATPKVQEILRNRATMAPEQGIRILIPHIYDPATPRERIEADLAIRFRTYPSAEAYRAQLDAIATWTPHNRLQELRVPSLVLHGEKDELVPPENARILVGLIANARLETLTDASHIFFTDQPEKTLTAIRTFLAD